MFLGVIFTAVGYLHNGELLDYPDMGGCNLITLAVVYLTAQLNQAIAVAFVWRIKDKQVIGIRTGMKSVITC